MGSFHMPSSWYDPPEYSFQKQAESICDKGLWGLYETNPETGKVIRDDIIPDVIGTEAEIMAEYNQMVEDYEEDGKMWTPMELTFDTCCEIAEREAEDAADWYDDRDDDYPDDDYYDD